MIWYFDSGASKHITSRKDLLCSLDAAPAGKKVTCANNASYPIKGIGTLENGLFVLDHYEKQIQACIAETKTQAMQDAELWHARFGHVDYGSLMTLQRHNMVHDLSLLEMPPRHVCEGCVLGKMHRFAFSQDGSVRATRKLQLVHSDVCGPMRTPSVGNSLYFVTFIDDFSRFCWVYPLKAKSDVFTIFQHYVSMVENETGCKVQTLRIDRGGEYMSVACAAHVLNRCPTRALKTITPYESWYDKKSSVSYLRVFGCLAYAHIPQQLRGKLDDKAIKCIFVGYNSGSKGYRLHNPATNKIFESRDVIFAKTAAQPMVAFDVSHMLTQDVFEGFLPSFVEKQESQQVDNFDQSFDQHVTPHDVEEIVREEQEVLKEERTLPKWVQKTLQDSKLDAPLPRKTQPELDDPLEFEGPKETLQPSIMKTRCYAMVSSCISWLSKKQPMVAISSCEAEYRAVFTATVECVRLRRLMVDLGVGQETANTIYTDSQSALAVARNPIFHVRTKHIEVHYHYVRERLSAREISLAYVPTQDNFVDLFTKALSREKLEAFRKALGLLPFVG
ncbi:hypothetical protein L7F22_029224 [Adiantum nelumboides]|nr:hypothetical protein [Adiantum nelumboides]